MQPQNIENTVVGEANHRKCVVLAPRVLSDGEIDQAIRPEILKRGGVPPLPGETLTTTLTSSESTRAPSA